MQIGFAAGAGKKLRFDRQRVQKVIHALGSFIRIKTGAQRGILRRHANRAAPGMTGYDEIIAFTSLSEYS